MIQTILPKCHMFSILINHCRLLPAKYYQVFQIPRYLILKTYSNSVDQIYKVTLFFLYLETRIFILRTGLNYYIVH